MLGLHAAVKKRKCVTALGRGFAPSSLAELLGMQLLSDGLACLCVQGWKVGRVDEDPRGQSDPATARGGRRPLVLRRYIQVGESWSADTSTQAAAAFLDVARLKLLCDPLGAQSYTLGCLLNCPMPMQTLRQLTVPCLGLACVWA